jgi:hypothetical protein
VVRLSFAVCRSVELVGYFFTFAVRAPAFFPCASGRGCLEQHARGGARDKHGVENDGYDEHI